jgi:hypothetical protein
MRIGAYKVATTLTVVSCLHRHASLDSMREVETVQPLVLSLRTLSICTGRFSAGHSILRPQQPAATELSSRQAQRSDHKIEVLHDLLGHVRIAA